MASYVINLERRLDRKDKFIENYGLYGPRLPLEIVKAVDGIKPKEIEENPFIDYTDVKNDYGDNPRVRATILSHMKTWKKIADSGEYGLIFEDDIIFREDGKFRRLWSKMASQFPPKFKKGISIIYFGTGDFLPIHVDMPSASLLKAQEKSHVKPTIGKYFGKPNMKSAYIFDWFGAFSYILSPTSAQYLLDLAKETPINKAVDVWIKDIFDNIDGVYRYVTTPLLTYHMSYDLKTYDSDTWGISAPISDLAIEDKMKKISFLIPTYGRVESLERTLESILLSADGTLEINFIVYGDEVTEKFVKEFEEEYNCSMSFVKSETEERLDLHNIYNKLALECDSDFVAIWDDDTVVNTKGWDTKLYNYYKVSNSSMACFQFRAKDSWDFYNPILTKEFVRQIGGVAKCPSVQGYIKFVSYLSRTNILVRDVEINKIESENHIYSEEIKLKIKESLENNLQTKLDIGEGIEGIVNNDNYKTCGIWINKPKEWSSKEVVGDMGKELMAFNKGTI